MTITILSSTAFDSGFGPLTWRFGVSSGDASLILTNPNALNVNISGVLRNLNAMYFAAGVNQPPFGLLWNVVYLTVGVPSTGWYVVVTPTAAQGAFGSFGSLASWLNFDGPYDPLTPVVPNSIVITQSPQALMPVYNPITFKFFSGKYDEPGYRYLVNVKKDGDLIAPFKLVPGPDGSGYIDISSILSNYTSYDFYKGDKTLNANQFSSYVRYTVEIGEEYVSKWPYTNVSKYSSPGIYNQYAVLNQPNPSILHTYVVGDQITVDTITTGTTSVINGLHSVVAVPSNTQVVIDVPYPGGSASTIGVSGSTIYSDSKKIAFTGITSSSNLYVYNGALDWDEWKSYNSLDYIVSGTGSTTNGNNLLLTSIEPYTSTTKSEDRYYMTDFQEAWFNFFVNDAGHTHRVVFYSNLDASQVYLINNTASKIRRFYFNFEYIMDYFSFNSDLDWIEFYVRYDNVPKRLTKVYRIYRDKRCTINTVQIAFLDRMGSILSIPFTLRMNQDLKIEREKFKSTILYGTNTSFDLTDRGESIIDVKIDREYSLETNWMNDAQMSLYEELISSPYTWIDFGDYKYQSCIIQDTAVQIETQKNKRIFRKSCKIKLANIQNINI